MAKSLNQVLLMGNLTRSPELKQLPNGNSVASFSLAINRSYKDASDVWQEATDYFDCVAWGKLSQQIHENLSIGSKVLVTGRLQNQVWADKDTGKKRSKVEVLVSDATFLNSGNHIDVTHQD